MVYAGNNQGLKWLTGRCDHRTPLTMTVPAQSHIRVYKALADLTLFLLLQICDLGSARRLDQTVKQTTAIGTYAWMAPEVRVSSAIERSTMAMNGRDCDISTHDAMRFTVVMLKCDWYCLFSGSRSNSLNSCKFPGRFPYGLETRLSQS